MEEHTHSLTPSDSADCVAPPPTSVDLNAEPYRGSFQQLLLANRGKYVVVEFAAAADSLRSASGYIEQATGRYVLLKNPKSGARVAVDAWAIKMLTFPCCE